MTDTRRGSSRDVEPALLADRQSIRQRFAVIDTANVSDVLDELGLHDRVLNPQFVPLSGTRVAGWAFTILGSAHRVNPGKDRLKAEACSQVGVDEVTVWAGGGGMTCFLGELIAAGLAERGCAGALVHGGTRDLRWLRAHAFPVFGTCRSPLQSAGRWSVDAFQVDVALPGATERPVVVRPGDFVLADEDGVVVVPAEALDEVLARAEELTVHEQRVRAELAAGMTVAQALERHGKL